MVSTSIFQETYQSFFLVFLLALPLLFFILKQKFSNASPLPPGPKPWPIIGNLLHIGNKPHVAFLKLAEVHGPLISLRLGSQLVVVGSSRAAAIEILKTRDQELSGRCVPHVSFAKDPEMNKDSIAWTFECTDKWKFFRTLMRTELFSLKVVDGQSTVREKMVRRMMDFLSKKGGVSVQIREVVFVYTFNTLANIYLSKDLIDFEGGESERVSVLVREMMELFTALNVSDLYPILGGLDLQGLSRKTNECVGKLRDLWESIIKERRESKDADSCSSNHKDFLDVLLESGFSDEQISFTFVVCIDFSGQNILILFFYKLCKTFSFSLACVI
ncbi:unnamed protein product [Dovyalis caffra]|uniref:Cytochrome P450 n=1 Tax=Dovyalis caffra TaxID=77055 RepID=A0AAV1RP39_9ROSI|nr:unnamed protein product [Dovyalis caffra]